MATKDVKIVLTAQDKTAAAFKTASANMGTLKTSAASVGGLIGKLGLGAGISIAGIVSLTKSVIDSIDSLNDLKDATGASIENISALEDIAARTGTSMDTVGAALIKLNQTLNSAKPGSTQAQAIESIGLAVEDLKRLDPAEALLKVAVALSGFADDGNKARLSQELFGKSLREVAPLLNDLAEKGKLVATVTAEQALEAEKFNKALTNLQKSTQDLARDLAGPMVKSLNDVIDKFREGEKAGKGFLAIGLDNYMSNVRKFWGMKPPASGGATGSWDSGATGSWDAPKPSVGVLPDKPARTRSSGGSGAKKDPYAEAARYIEGLQKQIEKTQELSTVQQLGLDINAGRLGKMSEAQRAEAIGLAQKIDSIKEEIDLQKQLAELVRQTSADQEEFFRQVMATDDAKHARVKGLLDATPTNQSQATQADLVLLQTELEQGRISAELYSEAVIELFNLTAEEADNTISLAEELGLTFTSAFEDAVVGGGKLSDVLAGLEQDIMRIITRKLVTEPLSDAISGFAKTGGAGIGEFIGRLFSADGGGYTGNGSRSGGLDGKGGFMAVLHPQETVVDHTRGQSTGNTVNVTINQSFAQGTSRATTLQAAADARRQLEYAGRNL